MSEREMDPALVAPFIDSAVNVLTTMAQTAAVAGAPRPKNGDRSWGAISGVVGMAGPQVAGTMVLSFDVPCVLGIVSKMLMEEFTELNHDISDAVGELTNMISSGTKQALGDLGYVINMATPVVITGQNLELSVGPKSPMTTIPFRTDRGEFVIEVNMAKKDHVD